MIVANEEKLVKMLKYVSEHNDFYKNRIKEYGITNPLDITQWPVLTRKELQENRYNMFSDGYKSKYFNQQLRRQTSSGSSGVPINVYWDYKDWYTSNIHLWRKRYEWYGIKPSDKYMKFELNAFCAGNDKKESLYVIEPSNIMSVNVSLLFNESSYINIISLILEFKPVWLYIQPSVLKMLLNILKNQKHVQTAFSSIKYIESIGEILTSDIRAAAAAYFKVPIANLYGSEEMNGIAYECPYHKMHILEDNVYLECDEKAEQASSLLISNMYNKCMPLIRYDQGDQIELNHEGECKCGCRDSSIKVISGRRREAILLNDGRSINSFRLAEIISEINNQYGDVIIQYKYIYYRSSQSLECYVLLNREYNKWYENVKKSIELLFEKDDYKLNLTIKRLSEFKNNFLKIVE